MMIIGMCAGTVRKLLAFAWIAIMLLSLGIAPGQRTFAEGTDGFELSVTGSGEGVDVTITLKEAKDLYAYDLVLKFDPVRLAYEASKISLPGFTVKPLLERGKLRLAHTSVGTAAGRNGKVELATIRFNRIRGGDADLLMESAKLVDSKLEMRELTQVSGITVKAEDVVALPPDVAGHWSEDAVREAMELGFVTGFDDGTFRPEAPVTRQEATVLLARALLVQGKENQTLAFRDAASIPQWALPFVGEAVSLQWVGGYSDGTFRGERPIARQELAAIIARTLGDSGIDEAEKLAGFGDRHRLADWAVKPMSLAVRHGILRGQSDGLLHPQGTTTRAEAVTMMLRLLQLDTEALQR